MPNRDLLIGREIDGYLIQAVLGHGGMGHVYRALDIKLNRYAALKILSLGEKKTESYESRFYREAQAIAKLKHPNIVAIYRFNEIGDLYYMAMEYIDGADLRWVLRDYAADGELMDYKSLMHNVEQICKALDYSHKHGVIHRDIKPSNIMITRSGDAILTDFGLALDVDEGTIGETFGSPHYIAPEQAVNSSKAVPQSDLYSLAVIIFQMLTGSVPYDQGTAIQVAMAHIADTLPDPLSINPDLHKAFMPFLEKALAKNPQKRFQSGAKLVAALKEAIRETERSRTMPGMSTLNKPADRIAYHIEPLPRIVPTTSSNPISPRSDSLKNAIKAVSPTASLDLADIEQIQVAVKKTTLRNRLSLFVLATLLFLVFGAYMVYATRNSLNLSQTDTSSASITPQETNALIEGQISTMETSNGFLTMMVYGIELQIHRSHPLYDRVEIDDFIVIEGHYVEIDGILRFDKVTYAEHNGDVVEFDDESVE